MSGRTLLFSCWVWLADALVRQIELIAKGIVETPPRIARMAVNQPLVSAQPPPRGAVGTVLVGLLSETKSALPDSAAPRSAIVG